MGGSASGLCKGSSKSKKPSGSQGAQPGGAPQPGGEQPSPLDRGPGETLARESTPKSPGAAPGKEPGSKPGESPTKDGAPSPQENGIPTSGRDANAPPHLARASEMPHGPTGGARAVDAAAERWGDLPPHARELFRAEGGTDFPPQYRSWIDAYYRRLARDP